MAAISLSAEPRTELGKGSARRTRRNWRIPAVMYSSGNPATHITVPDIEFNRIIKQGMNTLISLELNGKKQLVLPKALQRDPIKREITHVDFLLVKRGQKVEVEVPVEITGEASKDGLVNQSLTTIALEAEATHVPESVSISIEGMQVGGHILAGDVPLPEGSTLVTDPTYQVVGIIASPTAAEMDAEGEGSDEIEEPATDESAASTDE